MTATTTPAREFLPCPFCGSDDIHVISGAEIDRLMCDGCGAEGPCIKENLVAAIDGWNHRATIDAAMKEAQ